MKQLNGSSLLIKHMDACLTIKYNNSKVALSWHADDELEIDQTGAICILSLGSCRDLEFCLKSDPDKKVLKSIKLEHRSLTIMRPGTQQLLMHRIAKGDPKDDGPRTSLSFRVESETTPMVKKRTSTLASAPVTAPVSTQSECSTPLSKSPPSDCISPPSNGNTTPNVAVLFGTSITRPLKESLLSGGVDANIKCINRSTGGHKIKDICDSIKQFHEHESDAFTVQKIFISVGTNDIRNCRNGVGHLKYHLNAMIHLTKTLFPNTKIYLQSLVPIRLSYPSIPSNPHTAENVLAFNKLMYELCVVNCCYYMDIFRKFLDFYGKDANLLLFKRNDAVHLNHYGIVILARTYKNLIKSDRFNPVVY